MVVATNSESSSPRTLLVSNNVTPYDIAILGGGPGGYVAALHAGIKGARVALIERDRVGGICVTVGCIPSKALLDSSHAYWVTTHGEEHGIIVQGARFDLTKAVARKDAVVAQNVAGVEQLLRYQEAMRLVAHDHGRGRRETLETQHGLLQQGVPVCQRQQLLGIQLARQRPQARAGPAAQNDWSQHRKPARSRRFRP